MAGSSFAEIIKSFLTLPVSVPGQQVNAVILESSTDTITAHAGGTQAAAVVLTSKWNNITVCATTGDSVALPAAKVGLSVTVRNAGAADCNVFPKNGGTDSINALTANSAFALTHTPTTTTFRCVTDGVWLT